MHREKARDRALIAVGSRFGKYNPEAEKKARELQLARNLAIDGMVEAWNRCDFSKGYFLDNYPVCENEIEKIKVRYTDEDVRSFSIMLGAFAEEPRFTEKAGMFLSALIHNCNSPLVTIVTRHLSPPPDCIGCYNTKEFVVDGPAGDQLGAFMTSGRIIVRGDAGDEAGAHMTGGEIVITGSAGRHLGEEMTGGGIIRVKGEIRELSSAIRSGFVYRKGKLVYGWGRYDD
jgi:formylmethanofuran dehydrogenase subunit C